MRHTTTTILCAYHIDAQMVATRIHLLSETLVHSLFIEVDSVVSQATSVTTTSRMFPVLANTSMAV